MTRHHTARPRRRAAAIAATIAGCLLMAGCSGAPAKPTDPVQFVSTWLEQVAAARDSKTACETTLAWMTDDAKRRMGATDCITVADWVEIAPGAKKDTFGCRATGQTPFPGQQLIACQGDQLEVDISGGADLMIERTGSV